MTFLLPTVRLARGLALMAGLMLTLVPTTTAAQSLAGSDVTWERVADSPSGLQEVSADNSNVWAVTVGSDIYRRPVDGSGQWEQISGTLSDVSASGTGWVWGIQAENRIWKCRKPCAVNGTGWQSVDGTAVQVSANDTHVWVTNSVGAGYRRPVDGSGQWERMNGPLWYVAASNTDWIWGRAAQVGTGAQGSIVSCRRPCAADGTGWQNVGRYRAAAASVNARHVWIVDNTGTTWMRPVDGSGDWSQIRGSNFRYIAASNAGWVWGTNNQGSIYKASIPANASGQTASTGGSGSASSSPPVSSVRSDGGNFYSFPVSLNDLDAIMQWIGSETSAQFIDYCYRNSEGRGVGTPMLPIDWTQAPGKLSQVCATGRDALWGVTSADEIFTAPRPMDGSRDASVGWQRIDGSLAQTSADNDYVWGVNANDEIFRRPSGGNAWQRISGSLANISATGSTNLWGVSRGGGVFSCQKPCDTGAWESSGQTPMVQVSGGQRYVWGVNSADQIFKRPIWSTGYGDSWQQVPGGLRQVSASASDLVWGVNGSGEIYRCAKPCEGGLAWERVLGNLSQISANDREVWGVNSADDIYHLPSQPCPDGKKRSNGLCYDSCQQDWVGGTYGDGPVCWQHCPSLTEGQSIGQVVPYNCGIGCARGINACASVLLDQINAPINLVLNIISFGTAGAATSGASSAATGGAAAASTGVTNAALSSTQQWSALLNALEQAQSIAETASNIQDVFGQVEALETELNRWIQDAGEGFSDFTSPRIERIIDEQFPNPDDRVYIKRKYALFHFNSLLEQDGWRLGKLISGYASYEPTGIVSVIDAFLQPICKTEATPFPSVTILAQNQRTPDRSIPMDDGLLTIAAPDPPATIAPPAAGFTRIQNKWYPTRYVHNENGALSVGDIEGTWWSAQWRIVPKFGDWVNIQNRWRPNEYIHNQRGTLEVGTLGDPEWWSAQWRMVPAADGWVRIQNRWHTDQYIHNQNGRLEVGPMQPNWASALWKVE